MDHAANPTLKPSNATNAANATSASNPVKNVKKLPDCPPPHAPVSVRAAAPKKLSPAEEVAIAKSRFRQTIAEFDPLRPIRRHPLLSVSLACAGGLAAAFIPGTRKAAVSTAKVGTKKAVNVAIPLIRKLATAGGAALATYIKNRQEHHAKNAAGQTNGKHAGNGNGHSRGAAAANTVVSANAATPVSSVTSASPSDSSDPLAAGAKGI